MSSSFARGFRDGCFGYYFQGILVRTQCRAAVFKQSYESFVLVSWAGCCHNTRPELYVRQQNGTGGTADVKKHEWSRQLVGYQKYISQGMENEL